MNLSQERQGGEKRGGEGEAALVNLSQNSSERPMSLGSSVISCHQVSSPLQDWKRLDSYLWKLQRLRLKKARLYRDEAQHLTLET